MSSFWDRVDKVNEQKKVEEEEEKKKKQEKSSSFWDRVDKVNNGDIIVNSSMSREDVTNWVSGASNVGQKAYNFLKTDGYKLDDKYESEINSYLDKADYVAQYLRANKNSIDNYDDLISSHYDTVNYLKTLRDGVGQSNKYFSQWENEDSYKAAIQAQKDYEEKAAYDLEAGKKEIEELEKQKATLAQKYRAIITGDQTAITYLTGPNTSVQDKANYLGKLDGETSDVLSQMHKLEEQIQQKKQYLTLAERIQTGIKLSGVADPTSEYYDPDFDSYTGYVSTKSDEWHRGLTTTFGLGYDDLTYEYINGKDNGMRTKIWSSAVAWKADTDDYHAYNQITDDEISIYNYYYAKNGKKAAEEYLDSIIETLRTREARERFKNYEGKTGLELVFSLAAGLDQFESGVKNLFNGDDYIPASSTQILSGMVREDLADDSIPIWYNFKTGEWENQIFGSSVGQTVYDFGTTTANMAPSILASVAVGALNPAAGAIVGNTLMGASAAGNAYADALNRGFDKSQAATYGVAIGVSEALLQQALGGIGNLGGASTKITKAVSGIDNALLRFSLKYGGSIASEALEEGLQEILDPLFQNAIFGTDEDVNWSEVAYSALLGGLSAGVFEGNSIRKDIKKEQSLKTEYEGKTDALIQEGLESDVDTESYQLAAQYKAKIDAGKSLTGAEIRNLLAANQEQITPKDLKKIQAAAEERLKVLGQTEDVSKIAELATKYATGQKLTRAEKSLLANSKYGSRVSKELIPDNIISGEYTSEWAEGIGTKQVNKLAYNIKNIIEQMTNPAVYKPLSDRIDENEKVSVSDNGKATISGTDEEISIDKKVEVVDFVKDKKTGKITDIIINANGKQVKASEIDFADADQAYLFSAVKHIENITPGDAQVIIRDYDPSSGISVGEYLNGVDEAYTYGYHGYTEADMKSGLFTPKLSDEKANGAYELGKLAKNSSKEAKNAAIKRMRTAVEAETEKAVAEGKPAPKPKKMAITYNEGNGIVRDFDKAGMKLSKKQRAGVEVAKILHKLGLGTNFEFFESKLSKDEDGNPARVFINDAGVEQLAPAGVYMRSDGTIRIDLNAYNGRQLTLYALAHELTHFIQQWSTEKYEILAEYLVSTYEKTGMTMHQRVLREQARLKGIRGEEISYNEAYDEVVANAMMKMFDDGKLVERLTELKAKDKNLAMKLWEGFKEILNKLLGVYQSDPGVFRDTKDLMKMKEDFEVLQGMFAEALVDASENFQANLSAVEVGVEPVAVEDVSQFSYSSLAEAAGFKAVMNDDGTRSFTRDGKKVSKVTIEDIENSPIGAFINFSLEMGDITDADADHQKKMFADICTMACKTNDFAMTMQFVGSAVFTGMKANADKQYGTTYDFHSICTKTQAVIDAMSAKMVSLGRGLTTDEIVHLYDGVFASGNPVPCPECYVFSRWIGIGGLLDNIKKYQDYYGDMAIEDVAAEYRKMKAEVSKFADEQGISFGKAKGALTSKLTKEFNKLTEKIEKAQNQGEKVKPADLKRLEELEPMMNTVKGMTWLENVYFSDSSLKKVNPKFRVPNEVLFDLNNGEAFASQYKDAWAFRTTQGAGYGKAITPYAEARLGEGVLVTNNTTNAIKGKAQGSLNNYFLSQMGKLDKQSREALKRARLKQKIQAFIGGQRFQSTSDARYENASDYLLAALEMQAMGGMAQCYTKVDGAVPAFSAWGFSINQSLMPLNGGLDADGNVQDTPVGGMKPSVAFENRKKHESAGTITIGVNDNHIRAMFKQLVRDFIIPYHASGGKADVVAAFRRIQEGKEAKGKAVRSTDYSRTQSDKVLSDEVLRWQGKTDAQIQRIHEIRDARIAILTGGKLNMTVVRSNRFLSALYDKLNGGEWDGVKLAKSKVESQIFPNEFWDQTVTYEESAKITKDYLEYCEDLGFLHRCSGMVPSNGMLVAVNGYNENGERVRLTDLAYKYDEKGNKTAEVEEFFWKVLTDRRMYDNSGNYLPQKVVTLNDTTTDTVTNFAKHNQGRQYDKKKAEALAKEIVGKQYSSQETDLDSEGNQLSEDQQEFFEESKVRDEHGRLKVLYHGSRYEAFTEFDISRGVWLTPDRTYAEEYAELWDSPHDINGLEPSVYADHKFRLYKMYANIKNPADIGELNQDLTNTVIRNLAKAIGVEYSRVKAMAADYEGQWVYEMTRSEEFIELAYQQGFDGFRATEKGKETWCAFSAPNQVKLTTNEVPSGFYDIRYSSQETDIDTDQKVTYHKGKTQEVIGNERREESREDFDRRTSAEVLTKGQKGRLAYAYRSYVGTAISERAKTAEKELKKMGIPVYIYEKLESNSKGITTSHENAGAAALPGVGVFIPFNADVDSMEIVGHEGFHFFATLEDRANYISVLVDNIDFASAEFISYQTRYVQEKYFEEEVETDGEEFDLLSEEIFAYITGDIHSGDPKGEVHKFLRDYDAVKAAWDDLIKKQSTYVSKAESEGRLIYSKKEEPVQGISQVQYEGNINTDSSIESNVSRKGEDVKTAHGNRYSTQETDNISNRDMLANAFETLAQNSEEYKMIQEYKDHIKLLNEYEEKLSKLNAEIREITFGTEGERDYKRLRELQAKAKETAKLINKHDKKLLDMEASGPLRKVIEQERKKEAKKTREHIGEILQNKKLRAEQTEYRHKIRKVIRDLNKILKNGNKKQNVKEDMKGFVSKALELADYLFQDHVSNDDLIRKGITVPMRGNEPQLVKETEEILNKLYDEADSLTDEEFTRLDAKRKKNLEKLRDLLTEQRNERLQTPVYKLFDDLVTEYASLKNSKQEAVKAAYNPEVERFLRSYIGEENGETDSDRKTLLQNMRVADMTTEELWKLYNAYTMVLHSVRDANKLWVKGKTETIEQMVGRLVSDFNKRKIPDKKLAIVARNIANKIGWDYEKLHYALDRIGSEAFTELIMNVANSENIVMEDVIEAAMFRDQIVDKYGFNNWDVNKTIDKEFLDNTGKKFKLTLGQLMSLYAYSRRDGAWDHIEYGGFVFGEKALTNPKPADSYKLSKEQCMAITNTLTKEQKAYVEDMQKFLSETMGEKGNEVSLQLYGIKMFNEKNYFPIHIAGEYHAQAQESQAQAAEGFKSMSNAGFTHAQNPNAKAPFVLEGFNEVWADHVNEMSRYHGTVPALEDLRRVMNRKFYSDSSVDSMSVQAAMKNAFGEEAVAYFDNLYREANSGAITDKLQRVPKKLLSLFRKNSVAYKWSVLVQQPTSIIRAYAMIDKKYFGFHGYGTITSGIVKTVADKLKWTKAHTNAYNEMLKYAPGVTMTKEIGGFDTATGGSIRSYLLDTNKSFIQSMETENLKGIGKAAMDLVDDNAIANLPNLADKIAWIEIWNACKRETVAKHKDLATSSDEFMRIVGERFTEVIRATQVYDSIFSKSPMLKSKNGVVQYLVSFMSEPNTVANMAESALRDTIRGDWKSGVKKSVVLVYAAFVVGLVKSVIYAMQDDDEDETYAEKYIEALIGSLTSDFNPLNYIPLVRDVSSALQGYDIERPDMAIVVDAIEALQATYNYANKDTENMTEAQLAELEKKLDNAKWDVVGSVAAFLGIPVKNIRKDVLGIYNTVFNKAEMDTTMLSFTHAIEEALNDSKYFFFRDESKSKSDKLYEAIISGDTAYANRLKSTYVDKKGNFDNTKYEAALRTALRENDSRIKEAALAEINGNPSERVRIQKLIIADGFNQDDVVMATNAEINALTPDDEDTGTDKKKGFYTTDNLVREFANGDTASAQTAKSDIISTMVANGKTKEEAEKDFMSDVASSAKEAYENGWLTDAKAKNLLVQYAGKDEEEATSKVNYWALCKKYPKYEDLFTESNVEKYHELAEPVGISVDMYAQYLTRTKGLANKYDKYGNLVQKKQDQVEDVIHSLPITKRQKDALFLAAGYAESSLKEVPWR